MLVSHIDFDILAVLGDQMPAFNIGFSNHSSKYLT
jgi:hypothetical protein